MYAAVLKVMTWLSHLTTITPAIRFPQLPIIEHGKYYSFNLDTHTFNGPHPTRHAADTCNVVFWEEEK